MSQPPRTVQMLGGGHSLSVHNTRSRAQRENLFNSLPTDFGMGKREFSPLDGLLSLDCFLHQMPFQVGYNPFNSSIKTLMMLEDRSRLICLKNQMTPQREGLINSRRHVELLSQLAPLGSSLHGMNGRHYHHHLMTPRGTDLVNSCPLIPARCKDILPRLAPRGPWTRFSSIFSTTDTDGSGTAPSRSFSFTLSLKVSLLSTKKNASLSLSVSNVFE